MRNRIWMLPFVFAGMSLFSLSAAGLPKTLVTDGKGKEEKCNHEKSQKLGNHESPFACDRLALDAKARKRHFDELGPELRAMRKAVRELPDGYEFQFPSDPQSIALVAEWAAGERVCCPFFNIQLRMEADGGPFWLRLTGRTGTKQFIQTDAAPWIKQ
jgi:hypothetical protein